MTTTPEVGHPTVVVNRVRRRFRVPSLERAGELSRTGRLLVRVGWQPTVTVDALRGVSFVARSGEAIGVIGVNGSGKTTLLRLIAGLDTTTRGEITTTSDPVLLGIQAALQPELSGMVNARLGLLAMGFQPAALGQALSRVADQAGLGPAIHRPMRTYSSGMAARLRFAIATAAEPEILLIDEALATGDAASRDRAAQRMAQLRDQAGTVFLVTHSGQTVEETCTRAIWLHEGRIIQDGPAEEVARAYRWWAWNVAKGEHDIAADLLSKAIEARVGTQGADDVDAVHQRAQASVHP